MQINLTEIQYVIYGILVIMGMSAVIVILVLLKGWTIVKRFHTEAKKDIAGSLETYMEKQVTRRLDELREENDRRFSEVQSRIDDREEHSTRSDSKLHERVNLAERAMDSMNLALRERITKIEALRESDSKGGEQISQKIDRLGETLGRQMQDIKEILLGLRSSK